MKEQELKEFIAKYYSRENESCEWKEFKELKHAVSGKDMDDIISYVSAISNMNGGTLVVGVKDQKLDIIGIQDFYNYTPENLKFRVLDLCTNLPSENFYVDEYITDDTKKTVWIIHIPRHQPRRVVIAHTKAYMRIGDSLVEMTEERHNKILHELIIDDDWTAKIVPDATIEDLDKDAIEKARKEYKKRNPKYAEEMESWNDEKFLNKAKLLIQGKITRTAILLLGKEESEHFINPSVMKIRWSLKTHTNENKDYAIFSIPMILAVDELLAKIRNVRMVSIRPGTLFPDEMMRYDSFTIREPLNNCIAHQDYTMGARIEVVEYEDEKLIFRNAGTFIPNSVEKVVMNDCPESVYRNPFLVEAMRNLGMIETQGGGIRKLYLQQQKRCFPMPDYSFEENYVKVEIVGNIIDEKFARVVMKNNDLSLIEIIALDKVQKRKYISDDEIKLLKEQNLIEGRKPNFYISAEIAKNTEDTKLMVSYIRNRAFDDDLYKQQILAYLDQYGKANRSQIQELIGKHLPDILTEDKKYNKVKNILQSMRTAGIINVDKDKNWYKV